MRDAQVIVVGGGPSGSSTATFLARAGLDVILLDRAHFPRDKPCSEYMSPQASRVLDALGALEAIEQSGAAQLTGMKVHAPNGKIIHGEFEASHGFRGYRDRGLAVRRTILDDILLRNAKAAGACVEEGTRVIDVVRDARGSVTGVSTTGGSQAPRTMSAQIVIGADGLRSVVGRRLGLIRVSSWPRRIALVTHYSGVEGIRDFGEMHVNRGGYCGLASVGSGLTNVAVVVPVSRAADIAADRTDFLDTWIAERPRIAARLANASRVDAVRATGPFASSARHAWAPGAALVGDAADFFDPFTGEGIYAALRGGEMLAPHIAEALSRNDRGLDMNAPLRAYDRERRAEFSGKWKVERMIGAGVAFPALINRAATVLSNRRDMADLLVGVVGDFVPAREVLRPAYLLKMLFALPVRT
ncbi:MAG TPA: NAD(P)/FAD-dependent oxidoreductase [Gemmatimonadaceae bacterium]|nr:NAD(P)/FAD-dependent oxidoreductase [Gemmatimonadaceae bacterium]